jgi:hypothetical protein
MIPNQAKKEDRKIEKQRRNKYNNFLLRRT